MTDEVNTDPLESLRQEWERGKSPRLALQLAEEFGRREDFLSAITVLRSGLTHHPRHVASRILLGRFLVQLEQWPEARQTLEEVAREDPTHLVANKLLVKTYLALGDRAEARSRLDLYKLLNESDPDVEELESALAAEPLPGEAEQEEAAEQADHADEPAEAWEAGEIGLTEPAAEVGEALPRPAPGDAEPEAFEPAPSAPSADQADEADGAAELPILTAAEPAPAGAAETAAEDLFATGETPPAAAGEPFGDLFGIAARRPAPERPAGNDIFTLDRAASPARPAAAEPPSSVGVDAGVEPAPPATVSLGRLYLQQGHMAEAERTFAAILARDPGDAAARAGLAAARGGGGWKVNAIDLVSRQGLAATDPAQRKRAVLNGYLDRLRAGGAAAS